MSVSVDVPTSYGAFTVEAVNHNSWNVIAQDVIFVNRIPYWMSGNGRLNTLTEEIELRLYPVRVFDGTEKREHLWSNPVGKEGKYYRYRDPKPATEAAWKTARKICDEIGVWVESNFMDVLKAEKLSVLNRFAEANARLDAIERMMQQRRERLRIAEQNYRDADITDDEVMGWISDLYGSFWRTLR